MAKLQSIDPATENILAEFSTYTDSRIDNAIELSASAFKANRKRPYASRAENLETLAKLLSQHRSRYADLMTAEMGKTIAEAEAEIDKCARLCGYYAAKGEEFLSDRDLDGDMDRGYVTYQPLGTIVAVMPWNFPFWQVLRFAVPALMAGNCVLLKHASNVSGCALELEKLFAQAGFPPGLFTTLLIESATVARILGDSRIAAASVTGSVRAGSAVAECAGKNLSKTVLELGGSDACIVMPSADVSQAVNVGMQSRMQNNGQSCIAAKRFIIHTAIYDEFVGKFLTELRELSVGEPTHRSTDIGPLAKRAGVERLEKQVEALRNEGAVGIQGANRAARPGLFFTPGALVDVPQDSPTSFAELFGPVAMIFRANDLRHAIDIANRNPYGLASSIWTQDESEAQRAIDDLEAGATFVNSLVRSDPRWPFGGVRQSGYGRELSQEGILEFVNAKNVIVDGLEDTAVDDVRQATPRSHATN